MVSTGLCLTRPHCVPLLAAGRLPPATICPGLQRCPCASCTCWLEVSVRVQLRGYATGCLAPPLGCTQTRRGVPPPPLPTGGVCVLLSPRLQTPGLMCGWWRTPAARTRGELALWLAGCVPCRPVLANTPATHTRPRARNPPTPHSARTAFAQWHAADLPAGRCIVVRHTTRDLEAVFVPLRMKTGARVCCTCCQCASMTAAMCSAVCVLCSAALHVANTQLHVPKVTTPLHPACSHVHARLSLVRMCARVAYACAPVACRCRPQGPARAALLGLHHPRQHSAAHCQNHARRQAGCCV
jgi:hypothetical protein